jgi:xanthine dehydrogenase molybdopterin binding subunit
VAGEATYIDDIPEIAGTLHCALGLSPAANGRVTALSLDAIRAMPGVVCVLTADDIPGTNDCGSIVHDDPILLSLKDGGQIRYMGQPVFAVIAESRDAARRAAAKAKDAIAVEAEPPVLTPQDAHARGQYVVPPMHIVRSGGVANEGDEAAVRAAIAAAPHRHKATLDVGGQEQFYLEGQISYAIPKEGGALHIHCSTQHPSEMQHLVAHALHLQSNEVHVECRRMGGGFGGKESQSALFACVAAVAASKLRRPVKLRLDRDDDFMITGRRHCFWYEYDVGYDHEGRILGAEITMVSRAGHSADLSGPVMTRALCHFDNAYWLPNVAMHGYSGKTNTQSNTAFRGFGGPQGAIAIENILDSVARELKKDPLDVRRVNFYGTTQNNVTPYRQTVTDNIVHELVAELETSSDYRARREEIAAFNRKSVVLKRGLALAPLKFGISFNVKHFNQAGALVHVYTDGSILVNHGGTEMGQGLNTKVAQVVAHELGVSFERVRVTATDTTKVANTSATAASTGADRQGRARRSAADPRAACAKRGRTPWRQGERSALCQRQGRGQRPHAGLQHRGGRGVSRPQAALVGRLLRHPGPELGQGKDAGPPVLLLRLWRSGERGGRRHAHRRMEALARRHPARRGQVAEPGRGHRPGRRRLHPGHGLAHDRRAGVAPPERQAHHARPQHLQDSDGQRLSARLQRAPVRRPELRGLHPPQQGRGRTAAAAAVLGVLRHSRCGFRRGRPQGRSAAEGAGHERIDSSRHHGRPVRIAHS